MTRKCDGWYGLECCLSIGGFVFESWLEKKVGEENDRAEKSIG